MGTNIFPIKTTSYEISDHPPPSLHPTPDYLLDNDACNQGAGVGRKADNSQSGYGPKRSVA
jgi:hypothetical protein